MNKLKNWWKNLEDKEFWIFFISAWIIVYVFSLIKD